jgi:hypothetical protein
MKCPGTKAAIAAALALASGAALAQSGDATIAAGAWQWRASVYGWFPGLDARSNVQTPSGSRVDVDIGPDKYLSSLKFAFMGSLEVRKGPWSFVLDAIELNFGKTRSHVTSIAAPSGNIPLPASANVSADLKGFAGTLEAGYALVQTPSSKVDLVGGARYLRIETRVDVGLEGLPPGVPSTASVERTKSLWDGVVGVRGRTDLADRWFVPWYADAGTGSSRFTYQAFAGLGYHFDWGDAMVGYRHLGYELPHDNPVSRMTLGGPIAGVAFNF